MGQTCPFATTFLKLRKPWAVVPLATSLRSLEQPLLCHMAMERASSAQEGLESLVRTYCNVFLPSRLCYLFLLKDKSLCYALLLFCQRRSPLTKLASRCRSSKSSSSYRPSCNKTARHLRLLPGFLGCKPETCNNDSCTPWKTADASY